MRPSSIKTWFSAITSLTVSLALLASFAVWPATVRAAKPVVIVDAVTSELPDFFRPDDVDVLGNLEQTLEREAAALLQGPFPLFQWVAAHEAAPTPGNATLTLKVVKVPGVSRRVFIKTSYTLNGGATQSLTIAETDLYAADDQYLTGADLDRQAQERGRTALATLLTDEGNLDLWRARFIRKVPLAADVEHASGMRKFLILPVLASELQADRNSEFEAVVPTLLPGQREESGVFILLPTGPENGDLAQGKLECMVKTFTFGGLANPGYVDEFAKVIAHRVLGKVSVHATAYFKGEPSPVALRP